MSSSDVLIEVQDGILTLTFHRPERRNALTVGMYTTLVEGFRRARTDASVRVVVIRGSGGQFTSGNDLMDFMQNPPSGADSPVFQFLGELSSCEKPIVAAVEGWAVGIGTTLLMHCDLVYAADTAMFQLPFVNLGLVPEAASSLMLPAMMGHAKAAEWLLLGEKFTAAEAMSCGLVNRVFSAEALYAEAGERAKALALKAPEAVRQSKRMMKEHSAERIQAVMMTEAVVFAERLGTAETAEAIQAFFEKRKPDFSRFS